jgi:hypothetical protein
LFQTADPVILGDYDSPGIGMNRTVDQPEQRGFAVSVAADQTDFFITADGKADFVKQFLLPKCF